MRNSTRLIVIGLVLAAGLAVKPAAAQVRFAPQIAWGGDQDLAIGGRMLVSLNRLTGSTSDGGFASKLDFALPFDWFIDCSDCTYFEITPGLILPLTIRNAGPYLGAGLNIARLSTDTDGQDQSDMEVGIGLTGGLQLPIKSLKTFGEIRFTAGGAKQTVFTAGVLFGGERR